MGLTKLGFDSLLVYGREEVAWGTKATAIGHILPATKIKMGAVEGRFDSNVLDGGPLATHIYQGYSMGFADIDFELHYDQSQTIFDLLMGTAAFGTNGGTSGAGPPYTHTWLNPRAVHNSVSLQGRQGGSGSTGQQLLGAKLAELTISGRGGTDEPVMANAKFLGRAFTNGATIETGYLRRSPTPVWGFHFNAANSLDGITLAQADTKIVSFEVKCNNGLFDGALLGDRYRSEPERIQRAEVTFKITSRLTTVELLDAWLANTNGAPKLRFTNTAFYDLTLQLIDAKMVEYSDPIETPGGIEVTFTWKAWIDVASPDSFKIVLVNADSLITTPTS